MSKKIKLGWSADAPYSEREYEEITKIVGAVESGDYYRGLEPTTIALYLDESNGLVVHDVERYEAWLKENRLDR